MALTPAEAIPLLLVVGLLLISVLLVLRRNGSANGNGQTIRQLSDVASAWRDLYDETAEDREAWRELALMRGEQLERVGITPIIRSEAEVMADMARDLRENWSKEELDTLAFDIGIKPDDLKGDTLPERARALVMLANRQRKLQRLAGRMNEERPASAS